MYYATHFSNAMRNFKSRSLPALESAEMTNSRRQRSAGDRHKTPWEAWVTRYHHIRSAGENFFFKKSEEQH